MVGHIKKIGMIFVLAFGLTGFMFTGFNASTAQALPGFLEGPITEIDVSARTITVNGVVASVPIDVSISTPTRVYIPGGNNNLTLDDIDGGSLPGRMTGFIGGTCLCATEVDLVTGAVTITDIVAEPAENVIAATITKHDCTTPTCSGEGDILEVAGVKVVWNMDPRIPSPTAVNMFGAEIDLTGTYLDPIDRAAEALPLLAAETGVEGYFSMGEDQNGNPQARIYFYLLEIDGGILLNDGSGVAVSRARCRDKNGEAEYRIQGSVNTPNFGTVSLALGNSIIEVEATPDPTNPTFGTWSVRQTVIDTCVPQAVATFVGHSAATTFEIDIR